jgi:fluoride ion exporter CrcB/FEX
MNEELKQVAEAISKDPTGYGWMTYLWVCLIAAWGGLVRFLNSMRDRKESFSAALVTLITGLVTSVFVGVLTFYACEIANFDKLWTAICVAVTGHLGAQAMQVFEKAILSRLKLAFGLSTTPDQGNAP